MRRTKAFWELIGIYFIINAGTCLFFSIAEPSAAVKWILIIGIIFFLLLFATQFFAYTKKNALLVADRDEYYRQLEEELRKQLDSGQKKTQFIDRKSVV